MNSSTYKNAATKYLDKWGEDETYYSFISHYNKVLRDENGIKEYYPADDVGYINVEILKVLKTLVKSCKNKGCSKYNNWKDLGFLYNNGNDAEPLLQRASMCNESCVELFESIIEMGTDLSIEHEYFENVLYYKENSQDILRCLIKHFDYIPDNIYELIKNYKRLETLESYFHVFIDNIDKSYMNYQDDNGNTIVVNLIKDGYIKNAMTFVKNGADITIENNDGESVKTLLGEIKTSLCDV